MSDINSLGQISIWFIYFIQGIIAFLIALYNKNEDARWTIVLIACWILGFLGGLYIKHAKKMPRRRFYFLEIIWSTILAIGWCFFFKNSYFLLLIIFVQWMVIVLFTDKRLCIYILCFDILILTIVTFLPGKEGSFRIRAVEFWPSLVVLLLVYWICVNMMKLLLNNEQRNQKQEKSMDNIMKVLELKCYEAREATKSKSDFLANMSHEIRTPINSVLGMNEMILRESQEPQIRSYAANVENSGKMLLSLINDILDFSKIESGKMDLIPVNYRLSSVLNDVCNMIKSRVEEKELTFIVDVDEEIPEYLYGDEVRIKQIINNLLTNAVKYTERGSVTLSVHYEKVEVSSINLILTVIDTGKGIRKEDRDKMFESFQRVDEVKNRNIEGTGLGLAITNRLISLMNGTIVVDSEYGKGSTFRVTIPQRVERTDPIGNFREQFERSLTEKKEYKESFHAPKAKILIVDDVKVNILVAKSLLKQTKLNADVALSGVQAMEKLRKRSYDVVLLDHMMPEMDGIETLKKIKEERIADGTPFIALTANAVSGVQQLYHDAGFDDYLSKPIEGKELEKIMIKWLPEEKVELCE